MYTKSILIPIVTETSVSLPEYESAGASGMDVRSELTLVNTKFLFDASLDLDKNQVTINPGGRALIPTGIHVAIPEGYEIQVRPRSGLALKKGITVLNTPGTIDADFRGGIGVILINHSNEPFIVEQGDRIAQLVLMKVDKIEWRKVDNLDETVRGEGGFNSTGVK